MMGTGQEELCPGWALTGVCCCCAHPQTCSCLSSSPHSHSGIRTPTLCCPPTKHPSLWHHPHLLQVLNLPQMNTPVTEPHLHCDTRSLWRGGLPSHQGVNPQFTSLGFQRCINAPRAEQGVSVNNLEQPVPSTSLFVF